MITGKNKDVKCDPHCDICGGRGVCLIKIAEDDVVKEPCPNLLDIDEHDPLEAKELY